MSSGRLLWILFAVPMWMLLGCTRPEGDTSTIKIVVPQAMRSTKNASQAPSSSDKLAHVIINVTGDGIAQPILVVWDGHDDGSVAPPPAFNLSIPMGSNRLFQVLAVYKDSTTNIMSFYYGDQVKTLSQASESVTVPISSFSSGAISGGVFGRYLDTANSGPTGVVEMRFDPGNGKPPLLIERSQILNGWFSFFMLTGTPFQYVLDSGRVLFGGAVSLDDPRFKPAANDPHALRVTFPAHQRNSQTWQGEEPEIFVYGWFADPAQAPSISGKAVCRPNTYGVLSKMAKYDNPATFLTGMLDSTIPANDALLKTDSSSLSQYFINGGVDAGANAACMGPNVVYENFLSFTPSLVDGNGKDGAIPFDVPFKKDGNGKAFTISAGAADRVIQMQILPGLIGPIEAVKIFKKVSTEEIHSDSMNCLDVAAGIGGFVDAGSAAPNAAGAVTVATNITSAEATSGVSAAVCSVIGGKLFPVGSLINKWNFNSGGMVGGPPDHLVIRSAGSVNQYTCMDVEIAVVDANGMDTITPSMINLDVSSMGTHFVQIMSGGPGMPCSAGTTGTYSTSIPANSKSVWIKYKGGSTGSVSDVINVSNITGSGLPASMVNVTKPVAIVPSGVITQLVLGPSSQSRVNSGSCVPLEIDTVDGNFTAVNVGTTTPLTVSTAPGSNGSNPFVLYTDAGCTTTLPNTANNSNITSATNSRILYTKASTTGSAQLSGSITQNLTIDGASTNVNSTLNQYLESVPTSEPTKLLLSSTMSASDAYSGNCLPMTISAVNDASSPIMVAGNIKLTSTGTDTASFYSDVGCTTPMTPGNLYPWSAGNSMNVYFKANISGSATPVTFNIAAEFQAGGMPSYRLNGSFLPVIKPVKVVPLIKVSGVPQTPPFSMPYASGSSPCAEITFELRDETNEAPVQNKTAALIGFSLDTSPSPLTPNAIVYTDPACTASVSLPQSVSIPVNASVSGSYYVKTQAGATTQSYQLPYPSLPPGIHWIPIGTFFSTGP